jgi:hypothetical protein
MNNVKEAVHLRYIAVTSTLAVAAACWVVAIRQMVGMNMGVASQLGSFGFFVVLWAVMMAAMMLPGATLAVSRRAQASGQLSVIPPFLGSYLVVWTLVGVVVFALLPAARSDDCRQRCHRGRGLRAHATQVALQPTLHRGRTFRI